MRARVIPKKNQNYFCKHRILRSRIYELLEPAGKVLPMLLDPRIGSFNLLLFFGVATGASSIALIGVKSLTTVIGVSIIYAFLCDPGLIGARIATSPIAGVLQDSRRPKVGMPGFSTYIGNASMYEVHKFMVLDPYQIGYFITQVGLSAASFGVANFDINVVAMALEGLFDYRCAPKKTVIEAQGPQYQSICTDESCPLALDSICADQPNISQPVVANSTLAMGEERTASSSSISSAIAPLSTSRPSGSSTGSGSASASGSSSGTTPMQAKSAGSQLNPRIGTLFVLFMIIAICF
ncbi:hypothetical protein TSTA_114800 [Talaromyces stipitatus ATCC 10500]|uniref:Uncharacterized protein n=1 Tax=Talaromyces stipitatus (strain ATCC 10500 / CBS 375.48 / QM 6759 / NRRL 1006) TaxID=441959 RepID=B8M9B3_TALSN|nr:uncharacterized protein TSTA_114800 [Talaromyces stipitatus ATCC 10500]EED17673.1 hypothetical protein TSTA_114800 [Talaromyces stipitatus ATCC 10500]